MRLLLVLALAIVLAYGLWTLIGADDVPSPRGPEEPLSEAEETTTGAQPIPTTVMLVLTVRTEASTVPQGTVAGYRIGIDERVRPVGAGGRLVFTDAPAGAVTLIARAPGYEEVAQKRYLTGGVPSDAILVLKKDGRQ